MSSPNNQCRVNRTSRVLRKNSMVVSLRQHRWYHWNHCLTMYTLWFPEIIPIAVCKMKLELLCLILKTHAVWTSLPFWPHSPSLLFPQCLPDHLCQGTCHFPTPPSLFMLRCLASYCNHFLEHLPQTLFMTLPNFKVRCSKSDPLCVNFPILPLLPFYCPCPTISQFVLDVCSMPGCELLEALLAGAQYGTPWLNVLIWLDLVWSSFI